MTAHRLGRIVSYTVLVLIGLLGLAPFVYLLILSFKSRIDVLTVPPTLHFDTANPETKLAGSPFYVNTALRAWPRNGTPRRAGVSSFGIGGTNAHVVLEEAPELIHRHLAVRRRQKDEVPRGFAEACRHRAGEPAAAPFRRHRGDKAFE